MDAVLEQSYFRRALVFCARYGNHYSGPKGTYYQLVKLEDIGTDKRNQFNRC